MKKYYDQPMYGYPRILTVVQLAAMTVAPVQSTAASRMMVTYPHWPRFMLHTGVMVGGAVGLSATVVAILHLCTCVSHVLGVLP